MPTDVEITLEPMAGLTREHRVIDDVVDEAKQAIDAAVHAPDDAALVAAGLESLRDLEAFMEEDLALHIAKEELVLFPALRLDELISGTVDEMIAQHDEVRMRQNQLVAALEALDAAHDELHSEQSRLSSGLAEAGSEPSQEQLMDLWQTVRRLHWILQGHFGDEEDDLFLPAETLLSAGKLAELARQIDAMEAEGSPAT